MSLKIRILEFLYKQVNDGKIPQIRKGMVEEFDEFVSKEINAQQMANMANRMASVAAEKKKEEKNGKKNTKLKSS